MRHTPLRRALALLLSCSPLLWAPDVVLAQSIQRLGDPRSGRTEAGTEVEEQETAPEAIATPRLPAAEQLQAPPELPPPTQAPGAVAVDEPLDPDRYLCGPGDVLDLNFWGLQNARQRVTVDLEGRVFVARIGFVEVEGKPLSQVRRELMAAIKRSYPRVSFDLTLASPRTFLVHVAAGVKQPGAFPARATDRVSTVVARAGGQIPRASRRVVELHRRDGTVVKADLVRYALHGDVQDNPYLLDGDVVRVPFEEMAATIEGGVNRPGRYELVATRDLAELVEIAGGIAADATRHLQLTLVRRGEDDRQERSAVAFEADGGLPALKLQHDDTVRVPEYAELRRSVTVIGALDGVTPPTALGTVPEDPAGRRTLAFIEGDTARQLLERAGGPGPLADLAGAYVLRGGEALPVDLHKVIMLRDLSADRPVELGDTLVVPFKRGNVLVKGAVFTPGPYPHDPAFGVEQYLALAGGRNRFAKRLGSVRVITPEGETKKFSRKLVIPPGSSVVVPEREISPTEVVQILISAASVVVSGVAVVLAARR